MVLEQTAKENDIPFRAIHLESRDEAQNAPTPITKYALFHDGDYVTNEQMNDKKFLKFTLTPCQKKNTIHFDTKSEQKQECLEEENA
jgi:hypothetical protein